MNAIFALIVFFAIYMVGAITHENDMARNCERSGNAGAWVNEIKCEAAK